MGSSSSNTRDAPAPPLPTPPPPPSPAPLVPLHVMDAGPPHVMDADKDNENVKQLNECAALYLSLQGCLAESNRNWKACQAHVQALKACETRRNKSEKT